MECSAQLSDGPIGNHSVYYTQLHSIVTVSETHAET